VHRRLCDGTPPGQRLCADINHLNVAGLPDVAQAIVHAEIVDLNWRKSGIRSHELRSHQDPKGGRFAAAALRFTSILVHGRDTLDLSRGVFT
jgi:hypothetical protein